MKNIFNFFKRVNIHSELPEKKNISEFLAFANLGAPIWSKRDYIAFAKEGYRQNPVAHRCVRLIADSVASIPLKITKQNGEIHEFANLLARPNFEQTQTELIEAFIGHLEISGNAYLEMIAIDGVPREICVLRPDNVKIITGTNNWPIGWEIGEGKNKRILYRDLITGRSECLHLKTFNPLDDLYGLSPIEAAATAIDIHNSGGAWNKSLIDNAARPSGALVYKGSAGQDRLSDEQFERLKAELTLSHTGTGNAGRPLLLEGGLEWSPMSLSPAEMDFIEARRAAASDIALAFGVPPMLLGIPGDNTYSNYKEANMAFWREIIVPLSLKLSNSLSQFLSGWSDEEVFVTPNFDNVSALSLERDNYWSRIDSASFLTLEEKRELLGFKSGGANG